LKKKIGEKKENLKKKKKSRTNYLARLRDGGEESTTITFNETKRKKTTKKKRTHRNGRGKRRMLEGRGESSGQLHSYHQRGTQRVVQKKKEGPKKKI